MLTSPPSEYYGSPIVLKPIKLLLGSLKGRVSIGWKTYLYIYPPVLSLVSVMTVVMDLNYFTWSNTSSIGWIDCCEFFSVTAVKSMSIFFYHILILFRVSRKKTNGSHAYFPEFPLSPPHLLCHIDLFVCPISFLYHSFDECFSSSESSEGIGSLCLRLDEKTATGTNECRPRSPTYQGRACGMVRTLAYSKRTCCGTTSRIGEKTRSQ